MKAPFVLDSLGVYRVLPFSQFSWLEHGFGTRVSQSWPDPARLAMLKQVHSAKVVSAGPEPGYIGDGDALITNHPGRLVGVRTADCVPILIVDTRNRAVAAVHAGWRGTAAGIVACTISDMSFQFGTLVGDLQAAIGPAIGRCCYEVGPDVAKQFAPWWPELAGVRDHVKIDLTETNRRQLAGLGVPELHIFTGAPCTVCTATLHSFRRDREEAGRMIAAIGIRAGN